MFFFSYFIIKMDYLENTLELKINEFVKFNNKDEDN